MASAKQDNDGNKTNYIKQLWKWGIIVLVVWVLYASGLCLGHLWFSFPSSFKNLNAAIGIFGDYFGALNALFAGLAFAGIIVTIRQQSADLKATKAEMKQNREEMERQTIQFKEQTDLLKSQIKQQNIQNKLNLYIDLANKIGTSYNDFSYNHKGNGMIASMQKLIIYYVNAERGNHYASEITKKQYAEFAKLFYEMQFIYNRTYTFIELIYKDGDVSYEDREKMIKVLTSYCNMETRTAMDYYLAIESELTKESKIYEIICKLYQIYSYEETIRELEEIAKKHVAPNTSDTDETIQTKVSMLIKNFIKLVKNGEIQNHF